MRYGIASKERDRRGRGQGRREGTDLPLRERTGEEGGDGLIIKGEDRGGGRGRTYH